MKRLGWANKPKGAYDGSEKIDALVAANSGIALAVASLAIFCIGLLAFKGLQWALAMLTAVAS